MNRRRQYRSPRHSQKREFSIKIQDIADLAASYKGQCLFRANGDGELCDQPPSKCHVISRKSVLDKLKDTRSGKVKEFDWGVGQWKHLLLTSDAENLVDLSDPATYTPGELGTRDASTGPFACQSHDGVFNPKLDTDSPDFSDEEVRQLAIGRAILYAADLASNRMFLLRHFSKAADSHHDKGMFMLWAQEWELARSTHQNAHSAARRWRDLWQPAKYQDKPPDYPVGWSIKALRSRVRFAACVFYGQATAVMVYPRIGERHEMVMLHLQEDSAKVQKDQQLLTEVAVNTEVNGDYGVEVVHELMSRGNGVVVASPASYEALPDEHRLALQLIFMQKTNFLASEPARS